jgi:hypothetical protein
MRNVPSPAIGRSPRSRTSPRQRPLLKHVRAFLLLCGLASCIGSPATLALRPDFEVMTSAAAASVSRCEAPAGMTDEQFTHLVRLGMERVAHGGLSAAAVEPPFPAQRYRRPLEQLVHWNGYQPEQHRPDAMIDFYLRELRPFAMYRGREDLREWDDAETRLGAWREAFTEARVPPVT